MPQITTIMNAASAQWKPTKDVPVIADGGIPAFWAIFPFFIAAVATA